MTPLLKKIELIYHVTEKCACVSVLCVTENCLTLTIEQLLHC